MSNKVIIAKSAVALSVGDCLYIDGSFLPVTGVIVGSHVRVLVDDGSGQLHAFSFSLNNLVKVAV